MLEEELPIEPIEQDIPNEEPQQPVSIRDTLATALEESKLKQAEATEDKKLKEPKQAKEAKAPKEVKTKSLKDAPHESEVKTDLPEVKVPQSFQGANAPMWKGLPRNVQEMLAKREDDYHRELTKQDEERLFGKSVRDMATPYIPLIKAEGGDIAKGFQAYLNTAYILRTKSPQEKGALLMQLAREFGADMRGATQAQPPVHPALQQALQKIETLESRFVREETQRKQQEDAVLQTQVDTFSADPKNVHFETVKADMAALLRGGVAKDLQDAYDRAVYANPQTRSTILAQQQADEKQVADKKAKAEAAKRAGSSLKGGPGPSALKNGNIPQADLRKALKSAWAEHRGEA